MSEEIKKVYTVESAAGLCRDEREALNPRDAAEDWALDFLDSDDAETVIVWLDGVKVGVFDVEVEAVVKSTEVML